MKIFKAKEHITRIQVIKKSCECDRRCQLMPPVLWSVELQKIFRRNESRTNKTSILILAAKIVEYFSDKYQRLKERSQKAVISDCDIQMF